MKYTPSELPLVLLGAGGLARELYGWMVQSSSARLPIAMVQEAKSPSATQLGVPVMTFEEVQSPVRFIVAVAPPDLKEKLVDMAMRRNWLAETYIHPSAVIGLDVFLGNGCIVNPFCTISSNSKLGDFVTLNCRSAVGHDAVIGDYSTLLGSNQINGNVIVGDRVLFGAGSIVHPGRTVGRKAVVGIGSVVLNNVVDESTVFGNPAKKIRRVV